MNLIYFDESGQSGCNLHDPNQPIFVLGALVVPEADWASLEANLQDSIERHFPSPRPPKFEVHASEIRNGSGYFRAFTVTHRLAFISEWLQIGHDAGLKFAYRAIAKRRFKTWVDSSFPTGVHINPHVVAFALLARVIDEHLREQPEPVRGIFISDENREIIGDIEKTIRLLRVESGALRIGQVIEKGFFIDSASSLPLQLCDLCTFYARKKEEAKEGFEGKPVDEPGIRAIEPLIMRGNESLPDTLDWIVSLQKKERPGDEPGSA